MATCSSILAGKSHGQRSLVSYSPRDNRDSEMTDQLRTHTHTHTHTHTQLEERLGFGMWPGPLK